MYSSDFGLFCPPHVPLPCPLLGGTTPYLVQTSLGTLALGTDASPQMQITLQHMTSRPEFGMKKGKKKHVAVTSEM